MKIIVIDSHPVTHYGIEQMLQNTNSEELMIEKSYFFSQDFFKEKIVLDHQIVIVGLHITDIDSFDLISYLNAHYPTIKIILYSSLYNKEIVLKAIQSGAHGIVSKCIEQEGFVEGVKKISASGHFIYIGNKTKAINTPKKPAPARYKALTLREQEILDFIKIGIRNKDISGILNISLSTVEFHRKNIYSKYNVNCVVELLAKLHEMSVV
jgi:DNA-binding NarL/FixJ family response regulator